MRLLLKGVLFVSALCGIVFAQTSLTSVRGTVTDPSGAVVPNAQIELTNQANGTRLTQVAGSQGEYQFQQLVPGTYLLVATAGGFAPQNKRAELLVNQPATVNFQLTVQAETTTADVSAQAETLNNSDATIGNALTNATIKALPSEGRNVPDLLSVHGRFFNFTNSVRFDTNTGSSSGVALNNTATSNTLGSYASSLTFPRVQQFSLRYAL